MGNPSPWLESQIFQLFNVLLCKRKTISILTSGYYLIRYMQSFSQIVEKIGGDFISRLARKTAMSLGYLISVPQADILLPFI